MEYMSMYMPDEVPATGEDKRYAISERSWHRFWKPFLMPCRVWHAPFQSGRMIPNPRLYRHIRVVLTIHDLNVLHEEKTAEEQRKGISHVQRLIDQSDVVVCISEFTKGDVLAHCDVGGRDIRVIPNGVNSLSAPVLPAGAYRPARPFLFGMGYVNPKKNYHTLLPLLYERDDLEVVIAGRLDDLDYVAMISDELERRGLRERFRLLGPVSEEAKSWYLHHCAAFVHPSLAEGFGLPVLEAMSLGKPVFASDRTALPEIGKDVVFYFRTFTPEAMRDVFREGTARFERERMGAKVRERAAEFSWQRSAGAYVDIYRTLL